VVILRGIVRSGTASTEDADSYIANAAIIQESSAVYTSTNGTFYTSAINLDVVTCEATEYGIVQYSIPDFATTYDPTGVVSGSFTRNIDISSTLTKTVVWDDNKIFISGSLIGRILEMRSGIDDTKTAIIDGNTQYSIILGGVSSSPTASWTQISSSPNFTNRSDHSSIFTSDGSILVLGGVNSSAYLNDVWISDDYGSSWTLQTPLPNSRWTPRWGLTSVEVSGAIIVIGGVDLDSGDRVDVWRSYNKGQSWSPVTYNPGWIARSNFASVSVGGKIILMGGYSGIVGDLNDVWTSDDGGATWSCISSGTITPWGIRNGFGCVVISGNIILLGGQHGVVGYNDVWQSIDSGITWTCLTSNAEWSQRSDPNVAVVSNSIFIYGGFAI